MILLCREWHMKIDHGDCPGGDLDHNGIELEEPEKGKIFERYWGSKLPEKEGKENE